MKYENYWYHLQFFFIANFHVLGLFMPKKQVQSEFFFPSVTVAGVAGVALRALVEICVDDISAVVRTTDFRFPLPLISWAGLMHLILRILKF
jgi:hypothetical protein